MTAEALPSPVRGLGWQSARRVLAVRLDNLGDVLMTTPALAALRAGLSAAHLTLLTSPAGASVAAHLPMLDAVWTFTAPWMRAGQHRDDPASLGRAEAALVDRLAEGGFDAVVVFTVCTQSALPMALLCRMAGIPLRLAHARENPYGLLSDWVPETDTVQAGMRHEVQRQLDLVAAVGMRVDETHLRFQVRDDDRAAVRSRLHAAGIAPSQPYVVLHPGATAASRRWPAQRFGEVAGALGGQRGLAVVFSGDDGDRSLVEEARMAMHGPSVSLAGELRLGELAALVEGADLLVGNNSGPSHLAAAVGTPILALYALTNPQHTPWQADACVLNHDVPCRWCLKSTCPQGHHECLRGITPRAATDAALQLLAAPRTRGARPAAALAAAAVSLPRTLAAAA